MRKLSILIIIAFVVCIFTFRGGENVPPPVTTTTTIPVVYVPLGAHDAMQDDLANLGG